MLAHTHRPALTLTARQGQVLAGWIRMLDVDLVLAQRILRGPAHRLPLPPLALAAVTTVGWAGEVIELAPAVPAPEGAVVVEAVLGSVVPLGAYARRRARP